MEVFDSNSTVITRSLQHRLSGIKKLLRIIEIFLILVFITWSFSRIPLLVRISRDYFVMLANAVLSPVFIFLVSNVIGLSLFFFFKKSHGDSSGEAHMDFYSEIICNYSQDYYYRCKLFDDDEVMTTSTVESCSAVVYQDKQTIVEVVKKKKEEDEETTTVRVEDCRKRSAAAENDGGRCVEIADVEEEMSDEEFHRAIEAFIAKQVKFHKEEKFAIVPHGGIRVINECSQ